MIPRSYTNQSHHQQGAALVAVLVVAVIMVVLMGVVSQLMQNRLDVALSSKNQLEALVNTHAKQNELVYLLATQHINVGGVRENIQASTGVSPGPQGLVSAFVLHGDEIRADGYEYVTEENLRFSVQNANGLIPVNTSSQYWLRFWLKQRGYTVVEQAKYLDLLADFADPDGWSRPAGAEQRLYEESDLAPPRNYLLQTCTEMLGVLQYDALLGEFNDLLHHCSIRRSASINFNTIPISLWRILWPDSASKVANLREQGIWFEDSGKVRTHEPQYLNLDDSYLSPLGGNRFLINVRQNGILRRVEVERGSGTLFPYKLKHFFKPTS